MVCSFLFALFLSSTPMVGDSAYAAKVHELHLNASKWVSDLYFEGNYISFKVNHPPSNGIYEFNSYSNHITMDYELGDSCCRIALYKDKYGRIMIPYIKNNFNSTLNVLELIETKPPILRIKNKKGRRVKNTNYSVHIISPDDETFHLGDPISKIDRTFNFPLNHWWSYDYNCDNLILTMKDEKDSGFVEFYFDDLRIQTIRFHEANQNKDNLFIFENGSLIWTIALENEYLKDLCFFQEGKMLVKIQYNAGKPKTIFRRISTYPPGYFYLRNGTPRPKFDAILFYDLKCFLDVAVSKSY